ncbi:MAG: DMT family transporter [Pseudomonadota bacterium]
MDLHCSRVALSPDIGTAMRAVETQSALGIFLVTSGLFLFSIQDIIIKSFSDQYSVLQIVFYRSITGAAIMLVILRFAVPRNAVRLRRKWPVYIKATLAFSSYTTFYLAIALLPLADVATITFAAPIIVTVLSAIVFRDPVGPRRWIGVFLGFVAIVLVVGPSGHINNAGAVLAALAALTYAVSTITTRFIHQDDTASVTAFYTVLVYLAGCLITASVVIGMGLYGAEEPISLAFLFREWSHPSHLHQWIFLTMGAVATAGFYCLVKAYMVAEFSAVAPFEYTYILWSVLFGFLFWNEIPSTTTAFGIVLLISSNLYILNREMKANQRTAFRKPRIPRR